MPTTAPVAAPMANDSAVLAPAARAIPPAARPAALPKTAAFSPGVISAQPATRMEMEVARATGLIIPRFITRGGMFLEIGREGGKGNYHAPQGRKFEIRNFLGQPFEGTVPRFFRHHS